MELSLQQSPAPHDRTIAFAFPVPGRGFVSAYDNHVDIVWFLHVYGAVGGRRK